jgi:hypothetical protein
MYGDKDSPINVISELSVKTADENDKEAIQRRIKLSELLIKMGKGNKQTQ